MKSDGAVAVLCAFSMLAAAQAPMAGQAGDPRLREVVYDPKAVVTVPVKRGVVTLVMLDADEVIAEVASGLGGDCAKAEAAWCIAAQAGGRNLFVKPKSTASAANTVAVVTDRRSHSFRFVVLADGDPTPPVYRLVVKAPVTRRAAAPARQAAHDGLPPRASGPACGTPARHCDADPPAGRHGAAAVQAAGPQQQLLDRRGRRVGGHRAGADLR